MDQFSLAFSKIKIEYKEQKADGSLGAAATVGWDVKANQKV
jgi:type VI secretion system secreted protein Hcp